MKRLSFIGECMIELKDAGSNTLKSADAAVDYVITLGDDPFSSEMLTAWRAEGIGTELVARRAGALPGF